MRDGTVCYAPPAWTTHPHPPLARLAEFEQARPGKRTTVVSPDRFAEILAAVSGTLIEKVCRIKGNAADAKRHDKHQSEEKRQGVGNLIILCGKHHVVIDDEESYTVERLLKLKADHVANYRRSGQPDEVAERFANLEGIRRVPDALPLTTLFADLPTRAATPGTRSTGSPTYWSSSGPAGPEDAAVRGERRRGIIEAERPR